MTKAGTVVGVGRCSVDYLGLLPRYPDRAESAEIAEFSQQGGGAASTALATLALFGASTKIMSKISDDHFGAFIRQGLEGVGVDTSHLVVEPGRVSPFTFSAVEMGSGQRTKFWTKGNVQHLEASEVDPAQVLEGAALLLLDGQYPEAQLKLARAAREIDVKVALDGSRKNAHIKDLLELTDLFVTSERSASELAPASELDLTLRQLQKLGPPVCVLTLGSEGSVGIDRDGAILQEPAYRVDVKDTTGAGDVFLGALSYAQLQQWPLSQAMTVASVAAGLTCQSLGARAGIPTLTHVLEIVASR